MEALWLEISSPKLRGFRVGTFYRTDFSAKYYDKDLMVKLNHMLDTVVAQGKELLLGDLIAVSCHQHVTTLIANSLSRCLDTQISNSSSTVQQESPRTRDHLST